MAAGIKSMSLTPPSLLHINPLKNPSLPSRHPTFFRSRGRILDDHPLLRTLVKLVASLRRFVYISLSATPLSSPFNLATSLI
jgi:hypothetical protein